MAGTKSERFVSLYPRLILREVGRLVMVDYDMYSTCERLDEGAGLRLATWVERYYEHHVSRVHRASIKRRHGRFYVGPVSGRIVVIPEHVQAIVRLVLRIITDPGNFEQRDERLSKAIQVADAILAERGQPTHAERIRMVRRMFRRGLGRSVGQELKGRLGQSDWVY